MAIDTEDKRRSAGFDVPPLPDGLPDAEDRRHVAGVYRFEAGGEEPPPVDDTPLTPQSRRGRMMRRRKYLSG
jgi:hypothetical protein